jgi:hypothetical protein
MVTDITSTSTTSEAGAKIITYNYNITGPGIALEPAKYQITVTGENLDKVSWAIQNGAAVINSLVSDTSTLTDTYTFTLNATSYNITDLEITGTYTSNTLDNGVVVDSVDIQRLNTATSVDLASTNAVSVVSTTSSQSVYSLTLTSTDRIDISVLSNGLGIEVSNIQIQKLAETNGSGYTVEGIVKTVDESLQAAYLTGKYDIRGLAVSNKTKFIDTYATLEWAQTAICMTQLPLSAGLNNISILQDDNMVVGYDLYMSIETLGNYYYNGSGYLQIIPEYYAINLNDTTTTLTPMDVYVSYNNSYYPINIWGLVTGEDSLTWGSGGSGYTIDSIYNYVTILTWGEEYQRRMATKSELDHTAKIKEQIGSGGTEIYTPISSQIILGNAQFLQLNGKARTFVGGETTYGELKNLGGSNTIMVDSDTGTLFNPDGNIPAIEWWLATQRWHFTLSLPSSAIFVPAGETPTVENIAKWNGEDAAGILIVQTIDIRALGEIWNLHYESDAREIRVTYNGATSTKILPEYITINGVKHYIYTPVNVIDASGDSSKEVSIISTH